MRKRNVAISAFALAGLACGGLMLTGTGILIAERWKEPSAPRITALLGGGDEGVDYGQLRLQCSYFTGVSIKREVHDHDAARQDGVPRCPFLKVLGD